VLQDELVGTWRLVSLETRRADGEIGQPMGPKPAGMFIFDKDGNFSVQLHNPDRPTLAADNESVFSGYGALWGTYEVDDDLQIFTLIADGCLQPALIGMPTVRHVKFQDGYAVFNTTPQILDGVETTTYITWRRVSQP
jgi:Lipocalin-like domain